MLKKTAQATLSTVLSSCPSLSLVSQIDALVALGSVSLPLILYLCSLEVWGVPSGARVGSSPAMFPCRALRVRKKMSGEKMPVKMIGDILSAQLPHMQPYIRFCSCQLNGAALIQQKTDEAPDFKEFVKVRESGLLGDLGTLSRVSS